MSWRQSSCTLCAGLAHLYGNQLSDGDRALARIASKARPGDAVVFTGLTHRWNTT